jgi:trafficking protein particle complex subunit 6
MSTEAGGQAVARAQPVCLFLCPLCPPLPLLFSNNKKIQFLWFPCGVIRGALAAMGINATVQAESSELPGATFQIKSLALPGAKV